MLKGREGYFRSWDHPLMNEMYSIRPKPADKQADQWDMLLLGDPVPGPGEDLRPSRPRGPTAPATLGNADPGAAQAAPGFPTPHVRFLREAPPLEELPFILEQVLNGVVVSAYYLLIALGLS